MKKMLLVSSLLGIMVSSSFASEIIGSVNTTFNLLTPNNKIVMEVFDDPMVNGVSCYVSRAKKGGIKGAVGLAEDTSDASVACRQVGNISFKSPLSQQEEVFKQSTSITFKKIRVVRAVDVKRQTLVYLVYSDKLIDGSPKNSITAVAVEKPIPMK
jgi:CreA protein